jgi:hypothetical protein
MEKLKLASPKYMQGIISELETVTPKLVLTNYRTARFPDLLKEYVERNYAPFWGSIHVYAPKIQGNGGELSIKFDGIYQIEVADEEAITINDQEYKHNDSTFLKSGVYRYHSPRAFRLRLIPENILQMADDKYKTERRFYPDVYAY